MITSNSIVTKIIYYSKKQYFLNLLHQYQQHIEVSHSIFHLLYLMLLVTNCQFNYQSSYQIAMAKSYKDVGNDLFKQCKFQQAINNYELYLQEDHEDNKNAYFNLSLCYNRLNKIDKCIECCRSALQIDPTYYKVYYRLMETYRNQKDSEYETYINAKQFYRYAGQHDTKQKEEALKTMKQYKIRFKNKVPKNKFTLETGRKITQFLEQVHNKDCDLEEPDQMIDKYINQWTEEWNSGIQSQDAKWEQIAYIIEQKDYNFGINLAYFYLNQIRDKQYRNVIKQKIIQIKKKKNTIDLTNDAVEEFIQTEDGAEKKSEKEDSFDQYVFDADTKDLQPDNSKQFKIKVENLTQIENKSQQNKKVAIVSKINLIDQKQSEVKQKNKQLFQILQRKKKKQQEVSQDIGQTKETDIQKLTNNQKINAPLLNQIPTPKTPVTGPFTRSKRESKQKKQKILSQTELQLLYKQYFDNCQAVKTLIKQSFLSIYNTLTSTKITVTSKQKLLDMFKKRNKKFTVVIKAYTKKEKQIIYDLLIKNKIEEYAIDYTPELTS